MCKSGDVKRDTNNFNWHLEISRYIFFTYLFLWTIIIKFIPHGERLQYVDIYICHRKDLFVKSTSVSFRPQQKNN